MPTIKLTDEELRALLTLADEGGEGILTDYKNVQDWLGGAKGEAAAIRALDKLRKAAAKISDPEGK